jgi:hypothetical protein
MMRTRGALFRRVALAVVMITAPQTVARTETFAEFFTRFRAALASGRAADVAALAHTPFLYEGKQLDTAGFTRIVPTLFNAAVKRCFTAAKPILEDDRQVVFCKPYAFYFGRAQAGKGGILLLEFSADGEDVPNQAAHAAQNSRPPTATMTIVSPLTHAGSMAPAEPRTPRAPPLPRR